MAQETTSTLSAITKVFYVNDKLNSQINNQSVLYDKLWKKWETDAMGKNYTYAILTARNRNAMKGHSEGGSFPTYAALGTENVIVPNCELSTPVEISTRVMKAATGANKGAFVSSVRLTVDQALKSSIRAINRQLHSDGTDALAKWTVTDNTSGADVDDGLGNAFVHLESGATTVDLIDAGDNSTVHGDDLVVTLGAEGNGVYAITWTGTVTNSDDGDYLVLNDTLGKQMMGIRGVISASDPPLLSGGLHGLTVSAAPYWAAQIYGADGTNVDITQERLQRPLTNIAMRSDAKQSDIKFLLCNGPVEAKIRALFIQDKRHVNQMELDGGATAITYNNTPIIVDPQCKRNTVWYINPDSMDVLTSSSGVEWADFGGSQWYLKPATSTYAAAYVAFLQFFGNLACTARNQNGALFGIVEA